MAEEKIKFKDLPLHEFSKLIDDQFDWYELNDNWDSMTEEEARYLVDSSNKFKVLVKKVMSEVLSAFPLSYDAKITEDVISKNLYGFYVNEITDDEELKDLLGNLKERYNDLSWHSKNEVDNYPVKYPF